MCLEVLQRKDGLMLLPQCGLKGNCSGLSLGTYMRSQVHYGQSFLRSGKQKGLPSSNQLQLGQSPLNLTSPGLPLGGCHFRNASKITKKKNWFAPKGVQSLPLPVCIAWGCTCKTERLIASDSEHILPKSAAACFWTQASSSLPHLDGDG